VEAVAFLMLFLFIIGCLLCWQRLKILVVVVFAQKGVEMIHKKIQKRLFAFCLILGIAVSGSGWSLALPASAHGTSDVIISKDILKKTPAEGYTVNMDMQAEASEGKYNRFFLKEDLQTVSITINEDSLNYLFQNALKKPSVMTDTVTIGGETIQYAGLKTKGNYTLEHTNNDDDNNDRFSFTINFGKYVKKKQYGVTQNFYGCNKISFNNFYFDRTMMKEYFAMKLMTEMGLPTPQYGLAKLYINDIYYGVYFMVEAMDSAIIEQYQQVSSDQISDYLVKPEKTKLQYDNALDALQKEDGTFDLSSVLNTNEKGEFVASGVLAEQSGLWENDDDTLQDVAGVLPTVLSWEKKLNLLSNGKDFEGNALDVNSDQYLALLDTIMDTDEALRYFAAHSFLVQLDDMFNNEQNFGLYLDKDGRSLFVPWDYDLCFGCYTPGTAEETANYSVNAMYRYEDLFRAMRRPDRDENNHDSNGNVGIDDNKGGNQTGEPYDDDLEEQDWNWDWNWEELEKNFYAQFPLFYTIYQNSTLMEKYYDYMKDCAKIVSLGGTTTSGKTYAPGWFRSYIDIFTNKLEAAALEPLGERLYYLNRAKQPENLLEGLPNLSKIMALRSVGVLSQIDHIETIVSGYGCNLYTLGNASTGETKDEGNRTIVEDKTGIFARADYGSYYIDKPQAALTVKKLASTNQVYQKIKTILGCQKEEHMTVYKMKDSGEPMQKYMLTIPLDQAYSEQEIAVYSYTESGMTKLNIVMDDNLCTGKTASIQYIAIVKTEGETLVEITPEDDSVDALPVKKTEKQVKLNKTKALIKAGKTCKLKLKNAEKGVKWKSSNTKVATVNKSGKVTAKKKGEAVIQAVCGSKTYRCKVTVK